MDIQRFDVFPHLCHALRWKDLVFVSGQVCDSLDADIVTQTRETLAKLERRLKTSGSGPDRILFAQVWLKAIGDRDRFNEQWIPWVGDHKCARACVQAELADPRMLVEVALVAATAPQAGLT